MIREKGINPKASAWTNGSWNRSGSCKCEEAAFWEDGRVLARWQTSTKLEPASKDCQEKKYVRTRITMFLSLSRSKIIKIIII